jgi:hypothetical protein
MSAAGVIAMARAADATQGLPRPNQLPIVNVVALMVILLSAIPVYFAQRLSRESAGITTGGGG